MILQKRCIITYQEKLGNYNVNDAAHPLHFIITYQEKLGNYNLKVKRAVKG